ERDILHATVARFQMLSSHTHESLSQYPLRFLILLDYVYVASHWILFDLFYMLLLLLELHYAVNDVLQQQTFQQTLQLTQVLKCNVHDGRAEVFEWIHVHNLNRDVYKHTPQFQVEYSR